MENRLNVGVAISDANRAFRERPFALCIPLLLLYGALWVLEQLCRWLLPTGAAVFVILGLCALVPLAEFWAFVLVSKVALPNGRHETIEYIARSVAAIPRLWGLIASLYSRLVLWCFAAVIAIVACWFVVFVGASIVHGMPQNHPNSHHTTHPLATWLTIMVWSGTLGAFFSRYLFILPMSAILGRAESSVFELGLKLGRRYKGIVLGTALAEWAIVCFSVCAFAHFTRNALDGVRFGNAAMELIVSLVSGVGATWFVLLKLWLTEQALANSSSPVAAT